MKRWIKRIAIGLGLLFLAAAAGFIIWAESGPEPMPEALAALQSDSQVQVGTEPWYTFQPVGRQTRTGLIFYPGGRVDPRAYAPAARALAAQGYLVVVPPMPLNLAFLAPNRADAIIAAHPEIERWALGGHSLGGSMAAQYAAGHAATVRGLALWASYPAGDISGAPLRVASIYGTNDGLITQQRIDQSRADLPAATTLAPIAGGNHGQFGWYGPQPGDAPAAISREEQQAAAIQATAALLAAIDEE